MSEVKLEVDKIRDMLVTYVFSKSLAEGMDIEIRERVDYTQVQITLKKRFDPTQYNLGNKHYVEEVLSKIVGHEVCILVYN